MVIVLFGKPGAGKGTQAPRLAAALDVPILATGEALRAALRAGTPMGLAAKAFMDRGDLVADEVILGIIKETLSQPAYSRGAILDGVVRTVPQAAGLEKVLADLGRSLGAVLVFDIPDNEIIERISSRLTCDKCSAPFTGREPGETCDSAGCASGQGGGKLMRRADDEPAAVKTRLDAYRKSTEPVLAWYQQNGARIATIDAVGAIDDITGRARLALGL
ncbi:MAG TPA: nucleoside monophosphate kinase [Gemmatimonadaceae bacterium]|nr:nucleoside monophosphate kinase [Gemmatimonadaceae bacterium]